MKTLRNLFRRTFWALITPTEEELLQWFPRYRETKNYFDSNVEYQELLLKRQDVIDNIKRIEHSIINDINIEYGIKALQMQEKRLSLINSAIFSIQYQYTYNKK